MLRNHAPGSTPSQPTILGLDPSTGEHLTQAASLRSRMLSRSTRIRWYSAAVLATICGALPVVMAFRARGVSFPFLIAIPLAFVFPGGFGPVLLAGWGAISLTLLDAGYRELSASPPDLYRLFAAYAITLLLAVIASIFRVSRLKTLEREARLASALSRVAELRDTTDQYEAQHRAERDLLQGILATSIAGVVVVDLEQSTIFANARAEAVLGLKATPIASHVTGSRFERPEWRATDLDGGPWPNEKRAFERVVSTREPVLDVRYGIEWPDGRRKLISVNAAPLFDVKGELEAVVFGVTDITDVINAERELRARDHRLEQITSVMPGLVYQYERTKDGIERFPFISAAAEEIFGETASAVMQDARLAWKGVHPEDVGPIMVSTAKSQELLTPWICDFRIADPQRQGQWRWLSGHAIAHREDDGRTVWNGVFVDITDRRRLEDEVRQAQRIESIGLLAGGIAHDFNNVLTTIIGEASLLEYDTVEGSDASISARQIRAAAESGAALSRQLLGFARRNVLAPRTVDAASIIERARPLIARLLRDRVRLELDVACDAGRVRVDPALFDQVLMNLAVNASDAMPEGGVLTIRVYRTEDTTTRVQSVVFEVRDTGVGMTEEVQQRALEPFFTTKAAGKGTGLGLATSFGIVAQVGGGMSITSAVGTGTTVQIVLPAAMGQADAPPPAEHLSPDGTETLMVVDDDEPVRRVTAATLRRRGYEVLEAASGDDALRIGRARAQPVDLLVTDVVMPGMTGPVLAKLYLAEQLTSRVLYLSGYPEGTITEHGYVPDGVALLSKPFDIQELSRRVRQLLDDAPLA